MVVAATKLTIPTSRRALVPRPDLTARLDTDYRVGLVSAPAGYGKTATLASWAAGRRERVAWLSCDASDAEPTRFMSCLLSAIGSTWPGAADDALVLLERDGANTLDSALAAANELAAVAGDGAIVIDDLHLAAPSPQVLTAFIDALPAGFRFVAGTRSDPPLSLARLRLRGDLLELRSEDLRFEGAEVADFFALNDLPLASHELARVHDLTEGWPAGVQLAAIALQRGARRGDFLDAFAHTDRAVGDFLLSEVLASLPPDVVEFLIRTSVLDAFDAGLCREVTGIDKAAELLDRLVAANLFLVALDDRARWYRYHHLFGSFLRARLTSQGEAARRAVHDRAGRALERRGDVAGALQHAMAVGDAERAGQILQGAIGRSMSLSEGADVAVGAIRLWLHQYGDTVIETDPVGVVELLIGLISLAGPDDVPPWLERVQWAHPDADDVLVGLIEGAWAEHHQHRGQPLTAQRHLARREVFDDRPPNLGLLSLLHTAVARAYIAAGDLEPAGAVIDHALSNPVGSPVPDEVRHPGLGAFVAALTGELSRAGDLARRAERAADGLGLAAHEPGRIFAGLARLEIHLERHEDEQALALIDGLKQAGEASHRVTLQASVTLFQARTARAVGDAAGAAALLEQTRLYFTEPDVALRHVLDTEAVEQALRFDPVRVGALIDVLDQDRPATAVLRARLALLENDERTAGALLAGLPPARSRRARVEREVLAALSVLERDVEQANTHLQAALAAGQPERLVRTVVEVGPDVHRLLKAYTPDRAQDRYVEELLTVVGRVVAPVRATVTTTLVEPLSDREVTVLRYLCSRLTYQEIAAALFVSLNTLKSHVRSIYRKLGVASRGEAVEAGRHQGLV